MSSPNLQALVFFSKQDMETIEAIFGRLIPGDADDPGAVEAEAHIYLDHALAGFYQDKKVTYRRGLAALNAYSHQKFNKAFAELDNDQQDSVLTDMEAGTATGFDSPSAQAFFQLLFQHVREGTFCDPVYHGNRDLLGWKMIGFDGAQVSHFEEHMEIGADQSERSPILTLADMQKFNFPTPENGY